MATAISSQIVERLGDQAGLIDELLGASCWFRCPVCGATGDARRDETAAVLYTREAKAGGYSGDGGHEGFIPDQLRLVECQLLRRHRHCAAAADVLLWSALPPMVTDMARRDSGGHGQGRVWTPTLPVAGRLATLVWQPAIPQRRLRWSEHDGWRIIEVLPALLWQWGAHWLRPGDVRPEQVAEIRRAEGWYGKVARSAVDTAFPAPVTATPTGRPAADDPVMSLVIPVSAPPAGTDPADPGSSGSDLWQGFLVDGGLPIDWLNQAVTSERMLLVVVPAGTLDPAVPNQRVWADPALLEAIDDGRSVGAMVQVGTPSYDDRPRPVRAAPVVVDELWQAGSERAARLVADHDQHRSPQVPSRPGAHTLLAMTLTALAYEQHRAPTEVGLDQLAQVLDQSHRLLPYLGETLAATTLAKQLYAYLTPPLSGDHDYNTRNWYWLRDCESAAAVVHHSR